MSVAEGIRRLEKKKKQEDAGAGRPQKSPNKKKKTGNVI